MNYVYSRQKINFIGDHGTWVKCGPGLQLCSAFYPLTVRRSAHLQVRILPGVMCLGINWKAHESCNLKFIVKVE